MHRTHRYITSLLLAAALATPAATIASRGLQDDRDSRNSQDSQDNKHEKRVYDPVHKDYHNWDDNENQAWNRYLSENHKKAHDFSKASKREQSQYWTWRHQHPDNDNNNERRDH